MAENSVAPVARGDSFFKGGTADAAGGGHLEGLVHVFPATDPDNRTIRRNGGNNVCVLVRNDSGGALLPGIAVKWKAGKEGSAVDAFGGSGNVNSHAAGFVDDHLPAAGVPDNDLFWIVVKGPNKAYTAGSVAANTHCAVSASDGHVIAASGTSVPIAINTVGINFTNATVADDNWFVLSVSILNSANGA